MPTPLSPHSKPARPRWRRPVLLIAAAALAGGAWFAWPQLFGERDPLAPYQFANVQRGTVEDVVTATGTLQPRNYVDVGAQVSGQLEKIHVEVGTEVKEGELLAEIDPTVYLARVDASRAQLRNLRAQLKDREAQLALARIQLRRQQALMAEDATTKESLQTAEASAKSAEAQLEALRAQIEQIESTLRADEANLQYARILSPMTGTVVSITARQGQTLNTNQQAPVVMRIADLSTMTVQTQVSEADVSRLKLGMEAYFTTLGGAGKRWHGTLEKIEPTPTVTNNVVLYNALFDVPNPDGRLMTQMTAQVFFIVAQAKDALLIPMGALSQGAPRPPQASAAGRGPGQGRGPAASGVPAAGGKAAVRVVGERGALEDRAVEIGVTNRVQAQVLSGLQEGERVVSGLSTGGTSGSRPQMTPRL
ncbi:MAG TPA: efflux RND transporter periplasmic adaptor subunit [Thauera sp.]|uniref:efflux RND transporter periplasmic adaptor subunit n=1 Tax=Thauera sp. TaxID=1905334 RepID=UPI002BEFF4C8|nr:efflux RND transporter periplasmic adaptor subunit [Thauera sp.]HRP22796.1 efflux RND transporter periplasmic adaptor subunit [Thauera sp.]HRP66218.1 efflux RND transporter periplasmic adaptor subunit [Thauera sp.]